MKMYFFKQKYVYFTVGEGPVNERRSLAALFSSVLSSSSSSSSSYVVSDFIYPFYLVYIDISGMKFYFIFNVIIFLLHLVYFHLSSLLLLAVLLGLVLYLSDLMENFKSEKCQISCWKKL